MLRVVNHDALHLRVEAQVLDIDYRDVAVKELAIRNGIVRALATFVLAG